MRIKNTLSIPIIILLVLMAGCTLYIGYSININSLRQTLEAREKDKAENAYFIINSLIKDDIQDLSKYSKIISNNKELSAALAFYYKSGNDLRPLQEVMDQLYSLVATDIFLVTDVQGRVLYRANNPTVRGDLYLLWGMEEALAGQPMMAAGRGRFGLAIRAMVPIYNAGDLRGVLMMGTRFSDKFAQRIATITHTDISFGVGTELLAITLPADKRVLIDPGIMEQSIKDKVQLFRIDYRNDRSFMYAPLRVEDEILGLVISSETSQISGLLREKRRQLYSSFLPIFLAVVGLGSGLTLYIIRPLKRLQKQAISVIKDFSGEDLPFQGRGNEIQTLSHSFTLMLSSIDRHINDLRQVQEDLQKGERFLAGIFDGIRDGLSVLDADFNILRVNPAMERWYAHAMPLVGQKCYAAYQGRQSPCEICPSRTTLETGDVANEELPKLDGRGEVCGWLNVHSYPMVDPASGKITGVIKYIKDISEQKRAEAALRQSEEQLRQAQRMEAVGRLAGGVAHDFNNMLTAIGGYCELLLLSLDEESPYRREVVEINRAVDRATSLTRQLLTFSRKQAFQPQPLNLNEIISNLDKMLRRLLGEDMDLVTVLEPDLGSVMADAGQIEQAIVNLVLNSRDAMPQGGKLTIETANLDLDAEYARHHLEVQPGPYVMVAVSDTGMGMDEETKSHIFEPFFTTKEQGKGTGLGLSTVYGVVKQGAGFISVCSEPVKGAAFKIYLPRADKSPEPAASPASRLTERRGSETILLVEDEEMVRHISRRMLQRSGYNVLEASDGPTALSLSQEHKGPIHLLLSDVLMPGMSGPELADRLILQRPDIRICFTSGHTEDAIVQHGFLNSKVAFLQKPFRYDSLAVKVREVLDASP